MKDDVKDNKILKLYQSFYLLNINRTISEDVYIKILYALEKNGLLLKMIPNIENMIFYLNTIKLNESYRISILFYFKSNITIMMNKVLLNYSKLNRLVNKNKNNLSYTHKITIAKEYLQNRLNIIKSFIKISSTNRDENINKLVINKHKVYFNTLFKTELINRLKTLKKYYELDVLRFVGVKIKSYDDVCNMTISELRKYYISCINNIGKSFSHWLKMIDMYEQLELYLCENNT